MQFLKSTVGRKIVMAVSGFSMIAFVVAHLIGNTSLYAGPEGINSYAKVLHGFPPFLWAFRLVMLTFFSLHVFFGIQLTLENNAAKPQAYAMKKSLRTTFAARNMIWTGLLIAGFLVYHLLHFTFQVVVPGISASRHFDVMGRPDVFMMVALSFRKLPVSLMYTFAMVALALHLAHSIQSSFQTMGLNSDRTFPVIIKGGTLAAILIFLGYISFPLTIFTGLLK